MPLPRRSPPATQEPALSTSALSTSALSASARRAPALSASALSASARRAPALRTVSLVVWLLVWLAIGAACTASDAPSADAPPRDAPATGVASSDRVGPGATARPAPATRGALEPNATVVAVVDGDTIDVRIGGAEERIRLIGIDTPETSRPDTPVECYGPEATAFTELLLPAGTQVRIERDVENRDAYGRLLGYVHRADDGVFVNYELVRQGFATPMTIEPNVAHALTFVDAARAAERADAGLWGRCSG